jgi:competence protein ComEC
VIQDQGQVALVNSGEADTASFTVLPFLQKQGINQIDWAVALDSQPHLRSGWLEMLESLPVKTFYDNADSKPSSADVQAIASAVQSQKGNYQPISTGGAISAGSIPIKLIRSEPPMLQLQIHNQTWLLLGAIKPDVQKQLVKTGNLPQVQVLWWTGETLSPQLLGALQPKVAIASSETVDPDAAQLLRNAKIPLYWTGRDGAIQWTPDDGFKTTLDAINNDASLL